MTRLTDSLAVIDDVLSGRFIATETGRPLKSSIERLVIRETLEGDEAALVGGLGLGTRLAVVVDENTAEILGRRVAAALPGAELVELDHPKADEERADRLQELTRHHDGLVAVGSGTINDLCKYVSHRTGRRCAVFATAPSMDGYVSSTASITRGGFKLSLPTHAPSGVFFDLGVLAAAPPRMIRAGLGDTICRTTAQVDWLLSHLLLDTEYADTPFRLMRDDEPVLYAKAGQLIEGDQGAMLALTRLSVLSGLGVLVTGTTHCGSMGEHSVSHFIDMLADPHPGSLHGEQVGVATWSIARLQAAMLERVDPPVLRPLEIDEAGFEKLFGRFARPCREAARRKPFDAAGTERLNARLTERWGAIRERLLTVMLPLARLERVIVAAGMPASAQAIGLDPAFYRHALGHAHLTRDRYGFLDLAAQAGALEPFVAAET